MGAFILVDHYKQEQFGLQWYSTVTFLCSVDVKHRTAVKAGQERIK